MALQAVSLDDKYALDRGRVFLTGTQALVRLPMLQRQRDLAAGLNTAAFVTGYRGSPLGGVDQQMTYARQIGRASCRERACQNVSIQGVAVSIKKNKQNTKE